MRAAWMRAEYCVLLESVFEEWQVAHPRAASVFVPEVEPAQLPSGARKHAEQTLAGFPVEAKEMLAERVSHAFEAMWHKLPASLALSKSDVRAVWVAAEYYGLMEQTAAEWRARGHGKRLGSPRHAMSDGDRNDGRACSDAPVSDASACSQACFRSTSKCSSVFLSAVSDDC